MNAENSRYLLCCCGSKLKCPTSVLITSIWKDDGLCTANCQRKIDQGWVGEVEPVEILPNSEGKEVAVCVFGRMYVLEWKTIGFCGQLSEEVLEPGQVLPDRDGCDTVSE